MSNQTIDVIYELTDKAVAIWSVFSIDSDMRLLNTHIENGSLVLPTDWNSLWKVSTKAPGADLFNTRFSVEDYQKLVLANIPGFEILAAAYPVNDVESMLANRQLEFTRFEIDENENTVEVPDVLLDDEGISIDIRIAPTEAACDRYRELYPDHESYFDEDGFSVTFERGNFARHGK